MKRVLIGLFLIVIAEVFYDSFAPPTSTNWSVCYFACVYLGLMLITIDLFIRENKLFISSAGKLIHNTEIYSLVKLYFSSSGYSGRLLITIIFLFFGFLLYFDLSLLNVPFDVYVESVADRLANDLLRQGVLILLTFLIILQWVKRRKK